MKILNFGSCNIDYVYSIDHIVKAGETETTHKMSVFPGGKGLNQSIAAARAGVKIYHAGCVGCDGDILTKILAESGADISYIKRTPEKNGHAIIQVSKEGENSIFLFPGSNEMITEDYIDNVLSGFGKGDILLLQNEISNVDYIAEKAHKKGMCIMLNPSPFNEKINRIDFSALSYIILNEIEIEAVSGCDTPQEGLAYIKKKYPNLKVVLTLGSKGSIYSGGGIEIFQPAFKVEAVDTTAAGDTFTGYFAAEMSRGTDCRDILRIASAAAAVAVSGEGAATSIPCRDEVMTALESLSENVRGDKSEEQLGCIDSYIGNNLKSANIKELAKLLGYSAVYTGTLVKNLTGQTFSKTVQTKRCAAAAYKLLNTDMSVHEIAESVGYENKSFFRKVFKEKYGKNPLEFRKENIK